MQISVFSNFDENASAKQSTPLIKDLSLTHLQGGGVKTNGSLMSKLVSLRKVKCLGLLGVAKAYRKLVELGEYIGGEGWP